MKTTNRTKWTTNRKHKKQDNNKRRRGNRRDGTGAQEIKDNIYHGNYRAQMVHR